MFRMDCSTDPVTEMAAKVATAVTLPESPARAAPAAPAARERASRSPMFLMERSINPLTEMAAKAATAVTLPVASTPPLPAVPVAMDERVGRQRCVRTTQPNRQRQRRRRRRLYYFQRPRRGGRRRHESRSVTMRSDYSTKPATATVATGPIIMTAAMALAFSCSTLPMESAIVSLMLCSYALSWDEPPRSGGGVGGADGMVGRGTA
jgi:hypothetical protein